jgi:putative membrane protein
MAGLGIGAVNEIVEYIATLLIPETGVGGYDNTLLDLISDLIGALFALLIIRHREKQHMI